MPGWLSHLRFAAYHRPAHQARSAPSASAYSRSITSTRARESDMAPVRAAASRSWHRLDNSTAPTAALDLAKVWLARANKPGSFPETPRCRSCSTAGALSRNSMITVFARSGFPSRLIRCRPSRTFSSMGDSCGGIEADCVGATEREFNRRNTANKPVLLGGTRKVRFNSFELRAAFATSCRRNCGRVACRISISRSSR